MDEERVIIKVEKEGEFYLKEFVRLIPKCENRKTFLGDLIDEYSYLMNEDQERSITFFDDISGEVYICKRHNVVSISIKTEKTPGV